jgi:DNA invertase Pin-like site-specific DNA recombinase
MINPSNSWCFIKVVYHKFILVTTLSRKAALENKFDILLVYRFDRIGRILRETLYVAEWFVKNGIEVWSLTEGQLRFESHEDELKNYVLFWVAAGESMNTSKRTKAGMAQIVREGHYRGGTVPYGYQLVKNGRKNKRQEEVGDIEVNPYEAEYVRMIFKKYVHEGYGVNRIINYLTKNGIFNHSGNRFSFSSILAMIQNLLYIGILKSGETLSEIIPRLQIVDNCIFERAQVVRIDRSKKYEEEKARRIPLNTKGEALMSGIAFCGHCGGKLCLTTNMKSRKRADGTEVKTKRVRYRCYNKSRKICECAGQTEYCMENLDAIITEVLCGLFKNIQGLSKSELIEKRYQSELTSCINKLNGSKAELKKHTDALRTLQDEVVKAINGESKFDADTLNDLIKQTKEKVAAATTTVQQYESELENRHKHMANIQAQYNELISWADIFQNSPKGTKKMITAYLIDRVDVRCGYEVDIKFNVVYEQFCMAS